MIYHAYYVGRKIVVEAKGPASAREQAIKVFGVDDRYASLVIIVRSDQDDSRKAAS